jgi:CubicO group peptidase (beta-lactamase class C family)
MKKNVLSKLLIVILLAAFGYSCNSEKEADENNTTKLDLIPLYDLPEEKPIADKDRNEFERQCKVFYDTVLSMSNFNGGIIVAKNGRIIFEKYKGSVNLDGVDSVTENTPFHIASVSKTFTAMAILKLQEQGKLLVTDTLTKYFPDFNYKYITVRDLLSHRSGLPNYLYFMTELGWNKDSIIQNSDVLNWLNIKKPLIKDLTPPNTKFTYNNTNYVLLALLIEKISGMSYPDFMKRNVFNPLKMTNTFVHSKADTNTRSKTFDWKGRQILDNNLDQTYGDKNIYSTPRDLLKWDRALTHNVFLSAPTLATAYAPYSNEKPGIKNYGYGWRMNIYGEEKKIIFHNGWWHGNNATFIRLIKEDATIIVLSNRFSRQVYGAKLLVNVFGNYFDPVGEDTENIIPKAIPETFTEMQPGPTLKKDTSKQRFIDLNQKKNDKKAPLKNSPERKEQFSDVNKAEQ